MYKNTSSLNVAVIGGAACSGSDYNLGRETGRLIAKEKWVLICGGGPGIMEAACRGAKSEGGLTAGILPFSDSRRANAYLDVKIPTGLGFVRNTLVVRAADFIIAVAGKYGTLSEIGFALCEEKTVVGIKTWDIPGVIKAKNPQDAVDKIKDEIKKRPGGNNAE